MITLAFDLPPDAAGRVFRAKAVSAGRSGRTRREDASVTWYDAPEADAVLTRRGETWTVERHPVAAGWPVAAETRATEMAPDAAPRPIGSFAGERRAVELRTDTGPVALSLVEGTLRHVTGEHARCRLVLEGDGREAARLALSLGASLPLMPARLPLATLARTLDGAREEPPGAPVLDPEMSVDDALATLFGELSATLAFWIERLAAGPDARAVHQARVATRRMRSAILLFRRPLGGSMDAIEGPLKAFAATLGAARDWDVFLADTGAPLAASLDQDARIVALLAAAETKRAAAYAELARALARPATRQLLLHLSLLAHLRPWRDAPEDADGEAEAARHATLAATLRAATPALVDRRFRKLMAYGKHLGLLDEHALHDARKTAKKLRYAVEFLASALKRSDTKRLLRHLGTLQDRLGAMNDTAVGATLMAALERPGGTHDYATGCVAGWLAARAVASNAELDDIWHEVRHTDRFWRL